MGVHVGVVCNSTCIIIGKNLENTFLISTV